MIQPCQRAQIDCGTTRTTTAVPRPGSGWRPTGTSAGGITASCSAAAYRARRGRTYARSETGRSARRPRCPRDPALRCHDDVRSRPVLGRKPDRGVVGRRPAGSIRRVPQMPARPSLRSQRLRRCALRGADAPPAAGPRRRRSIRLRFRRAVSSLVVQLRDRRERRSVGRGHPGEHKEAIALLPAHVNRRMRAVGSTPQRRTVAGVPGGSGCTSIAARGPEADARAG